MVTISKANIKIPNRPHMNKFVRWIIIKRMFTDPDFITRVKNRWNDKKTILYTFISSKIQEIADQLAPAADFNFKKWIILGRYVWPNCAGYKERTTYQKEVDYMIQWLKNRYTFMDNAINSL